MLQNHLLQILCLVAMEPPTNINSESIRDEKLKVLRSLRPLKSHETENHLVIGQYKEGVDYAKVIHEMYLILILVLNTFH